MNDMFVRIVTEAQEAEDEFIFTTIQPFCEEATKRKISKAELVKLLSQPKIVRCGECVYYDPPHIEDGTRRYEYKDMPSDAFDGLGTGLVHSGYGVNVGGRCLRSKLRLASGKSIFMDEDDYCSRGERREDDE